MSSSSRRKFIRQLGSAAALFTTGASGALAMGQEKIQLLHPERKFSSNDKVRIAAIGMGIIGHYDLDTALKVPGTELVAVCDLYDGRLQRCKEKYGEHIFTTRDYREILERKDIDAVLVCTPDHWHDHISIDAMRKGKHVYCEKPMVHHLDEGHAVIKAQKETGKVLEVGSQGVSGVTVAEAKKMIQSGAIGEINLVEALNDRFSAIGAWQYSIPTDASPKTVDWDRFLGDAPKHAFDATRFFRWRNYRDYGTGVAGDLFVHLISAVHYALDSNGPERIFASGQLSMWKDGRDVPDVMAAIMDYGKTEKHPAFQMTLRVNFADGSGGGGRTRIVGTEGMIEMGYNGLTLKKQKLSKAPGFGGYDSYGTFSASQQKEFAEWYNKQYTDLDKKMSAPEEKKFSAPREYDDRYDHFVNFFEAIRGGKPVVEDATFGLRAAGPAVACNQSYFEERIINWDPVAMKVIKK
jgi:predicted dehydrogenase